MKKTLIIFIILGATTLIGCNRQQATPVQEAISKPTQQGQLAPIEQPIQASFDTNDYLDEALEELELFE